MNSSESLQARTERRRLRKAQKVARSHSNELRRQVGLPWAIASVAYCFAALAVVVWQFIGVTEGGAQLQVLNPNLAMAWRVMIVAPLIVDIVITIFVWRARRWTSALAVFNVLVNIVGTAAIVTLLLQGHLLASDLPQQLANVFDGNEDRRIPTVLIADAVFVIAAWDSIDSIRKARRGVTIKAIEPRASDRRGLGDA